MTDEPRIRLWTWHPPGFSITDGRVNHDRSHHVCRHADHPAPRERARTGFVNPALPAGWPKSPPNRTTRYPTGSMSAKGELRTYPDDAEARERLMRNLAAAYDAPRPEAELWRDLFLDTTDAAEATVLLRHPVSKELIVAKRHHGP